MIPSLAPPSVCVIDDEKSDYEPILDALMRLGLGCVHIKGDSEANLPPKPFKGLRIVFTDLHLTAVGGKDAASHTAMVFSRVVSSETGPVVVIIWSKYGDEVASSEELSESDLFKKTLLESFPDFQERLIFLQLEKPKLASRPAVSKWIKQLKRDIEVELSKVPEFDALWTWEAIVREAGTQVTDGLTTLALSKTRAAGDTVAPTVKKLQTALQLLVREQGGTGCSPESAPGHLSTVLGQSLIDHLEHIDKNKALSKHGQWLSQQDGLPKTSDIGAGVNGFLLTAAIGKGAGPFIPGTVYAPATSKFEALLGIKPADLIEKNYAGPSQKLQEWKQNPIKEVLIELSPACDVHQGVRHNALLVGGLILSEKARKGIKRADSIEVSPIFMLRWPQPDFAAQPACLVFFSRLKTTLRAVKEPRWMIPWFRLREMPTASLRNWHAGHAARVGYVSLP